MDDLLERLDSILERFRSDPRNRAPEVLSPEEQRVLREIEAFPCNRSGQDKSWILRVEEADRRYFAGLRRNPGD